jgi:Histidinol phosphatase and related phosphatases
VGADPRLARAIARLNHAGWHAVVATNQSGLARGLFDMATLNAIHAKMNRSLAEGWAAASTPSSSARTGRTTAAAAASPCPEC